MTQSLFRTSTQSIRVYYCDTDAGGIVYHAAYLEMAEKCRAELLREAGVPLVAEDGSHFVAVGAKMAWKSPARLDDLIECVSTVSLVAGARVFMTQTFRMDGRKLTEIEVELAFVSADFRPRRIPAAILDRLAIT